jgi:hypothetical protein
MSTKIILNTIQPYIDKNFQKNRLGMYRSMSEYFDKNSEIIYDIGPVDRLVFSDDDRSCIYKALEIAPNQIETMMKSHHLIKPTWENTTNPFNVISVLLVRHLAKEKKTNEMELVLMFLILSIYSSKHKRSFTYVPNRNIMAYTINNLTKKFKLKQHGNLFETLKSTALVCHETYEKNLIEGTDEAVIYYIESMVTRIGHLIRKIANEFYDNHKSGNYLNTEEDVYEKDKRRVADSVSLKISEIADNATINVLRRAPEEKFITLSANMSEVSVNAIRSAVNSIKDKKDKDVREIFMLILQLFLESGNHPIEAIATTDFINYCYTVFAKSNTVDDTVLRIKEILDEWLTMCSPNYVKSNRVATKSNFRKAIYFYYVFMLQQSHMRG